MNWEAAGAIGEIAGAALIVATLLFLGRQIGQQARADTASTTGSWLADYNGMVLEVLRDAEVAELFRQGLTDFEALGLNDQMRFHAWMVTHLLSAQVMYFQYLDGVIQKPTAEQILRFNSMMLKTKGGLHWWATARAIWRPEFVQHMDELIADSAPITEIWPWFAIPEDSTSHLTNR